MESLCLCPVLPGTWLSSAGSHLPWLRITSDYRSIWGTHAKRTEDSAQGGKLVSVHKLGAASQPFVTLLELWK